MAGAFRGDLQKLNQLVRRVRRLGDDAFLERMNRALSESAIREVRRGFREARNPYAEKWKDKKKPNGSAPLHGRTGLLRTSFSPQDVTSRGFRLTSDRIYAAVHQYGSRKRNIDARHMLPTAERGLGLWARSFREVMAKRVRELFRR